MDIMHSEHAEDIGGVVHCFSYSKEIAKECVDMGFYIGVGGVVTFKNGKKLREVVDRIPMEKILLETDCPYLSPEPHRGERNSFKPVLRGKRDSKHKRNQRRRRNTYYRRKCKAYVRPNDGGINGISWKCSTHKGSVEQIQYERQEKVWTELSYRQRST